MKKVVLGILAISLSLFASQINIAVAANVSYAINDLIEEFNKTNPDTKVQVTLGSSGKLTAQIKNGAPYNIFMAANMKYPQSLYSENIAITKPLVYAQGSLAILTTKKLNLSKGINLAVENSIGKIAIANPKTAPYGKAAIEAMKNANIQDKVTDKYVYAESISQTVTYAITAADMGFIAKSSLYSPKMSKYKEGINWIDVDSKLYTPINQGIVILNNAKENKEVKAFYDFILSEKAKNIFKRYGYLVP
ncbi:molybdate ABC transporter substrate-binding protein [Arcobacter sp.]|uniref:molybdate ABC transporter substrate-binding protein n=1 Tax=Arcobacter sp. TaxID=1872629 RepID=UPI003D0E40DC